MKPILTLILMFFSITLSFAGEWNNRAVRASDAEIFTLDQLAQLSKSFKNIIVGEEHFNRSVMNAEGAIIRAFVNGSGVKGSFSISWEFLNYADQDLTDRELDRYKKNELDLPTLYKNLDIDPMLSLYYPLFESAKDFSGKIIGVNVPDEQKAPIVTGGITAADPKIVPPDFELGSAQYRERFSQALGGGHATPEQLERYFEAQCLTDDLIAYHTLTGEAQSLEKRFAVMGAFHTDFKQGAVARIARRAPNDKNIVIRLVDASNYRVEELRNLLMDPKYGEIADFVYFVNEPKR